MRYASPSQLKSKSGFCAFCVHWYDPANSHISIKNARLGQWNYDETAIEVCRKKNLKKKGSDRCPYYECKI
jgi:hypothetical protein